MDTFHTIMVLLTVAAALAVCFALVSLLFRRQSAQLREELTQAGETILAGPDVGLYQRVHFIMTVGTNGVAALTDRGLIFRKPFGGDVRIPYSQMLEVSENVWFHGNYRNGRPWLILKTSDGGVYGFMLRDQPRWVTEIQARMGR